MNIGKKFFITSGKSVSPISGLNAFDKALLKAGIGNTNIVSVSSILPETCTQIGRVALPKGAVVHCVMARMDGAEGERISAGLAWAKFKKQKWGIVAEDHGKYSAKTMMEQLRWKITEMAKLRGLKLGDIEYKIETITEIPWDKEGCVIAALIFLDENDYPI
jgi:arginine decarboxylase